MNYPKISEERIQRSLPRIRKQIHGLEQPLEIAAWHVHGEPVPAKHALRQKYEPFSLGQEWGGLWDTTWFRFRGQVPADWGGREVIARVRLTDFDYEGFTAEGIIYRDGELKRALNANRCEVDIAHPAKGGESFEFFVEAAANGGADKDGFTPGLSSPDYQGPPQYRLHMANLVWVDRDVAAYYYDFKTAAEVLETLPENSQRRAELCRALNESLDLFDIGNGGLAKARAALADVLSRKNSQTVHTISAVGHAHIDTAWLWPLRESIRKCARTFSTALDYMEDYPEYVFACSQPQQYAWMKVLYPAIWEGIKKAVARGQWETVGSMWVEADCNLTSGESLVRQILYGKRFFLEEFGMETRDCWLPDVFGYSGAMPQIFKEAGIDYFLTQKMSWNQFNTFPHHTFLWEGIDGSTVFTHFPPADNYSADTGAKFLQKNVSNFRNHGWATRSLLLYGYGDGGGGPSIEMLEKARRLRDFEGLPRLEQEKALTFFEKASADASSLPAWSGELYLEGHRGTLTTQAKNKLHNRRSEFLLHDAEFFDAMSAVLCPNRAESAADPKRAVYDVTGLDKTNSSPHRGALERAWKLILLNQFHDIIPGSSIRWVYEDSERDYKAVRELGESVRDSAFASLAAEIDTSAFAEPVIVSNTLGMERREVVQLPNGREATATVPSHGYTVMDQAARESDPPAEAARLTRTDEGIVLENGLVRAVLDTQGRLCSITDLQLNREALAPGEFGNVFHLHSDIPNRYDAWDVDIFYRKSAKAINGLESVTVVETGPWRVSVDLVRCFGDSKITQRITLRSGSGRIDFQTEVDWREDRKFLKVAFPINVRSSRATYEIQFGHIERPTHSNTTWDMAKFEVCGHKWADLSETGFGVALLNDCKYGYDIHGNVMRLSLLRAPVSPDPLADRGKHRFTYSILTHAGDFRKGRVIEEAAALNNPLWMQPIASRPGRLPSTQSFFQCLPEGVVLDTIKRAEDDESLILRLYEAHGARGSGSIRTAFPVKKAVWTDLLEREIREAEINGNEIPFPFRPFQILTLKLEVEPPGHDRLS